MPRAKTFEDHQFEEWMAFLGETATVPERDQLIAALSFKAGMRIGEIAKIDLNALLDIKGRLARKIVVSPLVGKKGRGRSIDMHPIVQAAAERFIKRFPKAKIIAFSPVPFRYVSLSDPKRWQRCRSMSGTIASIPSRCAATSTCSSSVQAFRVPRRTPVGAPSERSWLGWQITMAARSRTFSTRWVTAF